MAEMHFAKVSVLYSGFYDYRLHFVYPKQLMFSPWGYGLSLPGRQDQMSFQIGLCHLVYAGLSWMAMKGIFRQSRLTGLHMDFFTVVGLLAALSTTAVSRPIWALIPLLRFVQFPWRLLAIVTFAVSFLAGGLVCCLSQKRLQWLVLVLATASLVGVNLPYCHPQGYVDDLKDATRFPPERVQGEHGFRDFIPIWVKTPPAPWPSEKLTTLFGSARIETTQLRAVTYRFVVDAALDSQLQCRTFYFPGWQVFIDGRPTPIDPDNEHGLIEFIVPRGRHQLRIRFGSTPIRLTAAMVSGLALVSLVWLALGEFWSRSTLLRGRRW